MKRIRLPNGNFVNAIDRLSALYTYREIFENQIYLTSGLQLLDGSTVFDVGANIGLFSKFLIKRFTNLKIYAFEPIPEIFHVMETNLADTQDVIKKYNLGLSEKPGIAEFCYYPKVSAMSTAYPFDIKGKIVSYAKNYWETEFGSNHLTRLVPMFLRYFVVERVLRYLLCKQRVNCSLVTLSDIIAENNIEQIDLLKIDTENAEKQILAGILETDWHKIKQISMEVHCHNQGDDDLINEFVKLLKSKGFHLQIADENVLTELDTQMIYAWK